MQDTTPAEGAPLHWEEVALTPLESDDIDKLQAWQNAPAVKDLTMGFRLPVRRDAVEGWLRSLREDHRHTRAVYGIRWTGKLVGTVQLNGIDPFQRKSSLGIYIGDTGDRQRGVGYMSCALILDFAFNGLDLRRVDLEVMSDASPAIALYERLGFQREGVKRQAYFAAGKYHDVFIYGLLREEFSLTIPLAASRLVLAPRGRES